MPTNQHGNGNVLKNEGKQSGLEAKQVICYYQEKEREVGLASIMGGSPRIGFN